MRPRLVDPPEDIAPTEDVRFAIDLSNLLDKHDMIWRRTMPSEWLEGAPVGNGTFGATIHDQPSSLCFTLGKPDVWNRRNDQRSWYPGDSFEELRKTYLTKDRAGYDQLLTDLAARRPVDAPHLTTCGTFRLHLDEGMNATRLEMRVGLADGIARLAYDDRKVETLISRKYDVMLVTIDRGRGIPYLDGKWDPYDRKLPSPRLGWELARAPLADNPPATCERRDGAYLLTQRLTDNGRYTIGVAFDGFDEAKHATIPGRMMGQLTRPRGRQAYLLLTIATTSETDKPELLCLERIRRARAAGPYAIRESHKHWWRNYWMRGLAAVDDDLVERWYFRSLYLTGSMLRPGCQSPGLQGVWCGENYPMWSADFHSNVNIQAIYWQTLTNNRLDLMEPFLRLYHDMAPHGREVASRYFQCRGVKYPHAGSIGGHEISSPYASMLDTDPCETAWIAMMYWEYYRYTLDREYLERIGYPILRDAALFVTDRLTKNDAGQWHLDPSVHFETHSDFDNWGRNSLYSQAFVRAVLRRAIAASQETGADTDLRREWQSKLEDLAQPPTEAGRYFKSFEGLPPRWDRHNFMLPLVFPAELVSAWHGPSDWQRLAHATWKEICDNEVGSSTGGAWCGGQGLAEIIRLGAKETAFTRARWDPKGCPNGFSVQSGEGFGGRFMQCDHGPGMARVLADMMLIAPGGVVRLFEGIPQTRAARFHSLRAPAGVLISAEKRGRICDYVLVCPTVETVLKIANPWPRAVIEDLQNGQVLRETDRRVIELRVMPPKRYLLHQAGSNPRELPRVPFDFSDQAATAKEPRQ